MISVARWLFIILLLVAACVGHAAEGDIAVGVRYWVTDGHTNWRHDASFLNSDFGVPTSELDYQRVNSEILEVNVLTGLFDGDALRVAFGFGNINEGRLVDDDYYSASGAVNQGTSVTGAHRFSRTYSDIVGEGVFHLKGDFLPGGLSFSPPFGRFQVGFNAQFWQEEYRAQGLLQVECTDYTPPLDADDSCYPVGFYGYDGVDVISNKVRWLGFGASIEGLVAILPNLSLTLNGTFYPLVSLVNEDIHHLRTTGDSALAQNPSIRMTGTGVGYDLEIGFEYRINRDLTASLGYRRWERRVRNQTITFYSPGGGGSSARLMDFSTSRDGYMAGLEMLF